MRYNYTLLGLVLFFICGSLQAQLVPVPLDVEHATQVVEFNTDGEKVDFYQKNYVYSTLGDSMGITWVKIIHSSSNRGWGFQVCDKNLCYLPSISTRDFKMSPYDTSEMTVHMRTRGNDGDSAVIYVKLFRNDIDNSDSMYIKVKFVAQSPTAIGYAEVERTDVSIFPNPATRYITIKSPSHIGNVFVYDLLGRQVKKDNLNGKHAGVVSLDKLRAGTYFVTVFSTSGKRLKTIRMIKQTMGS